MSHTTTPELLGTLQMAHEKKASDVYLLPNEPVSLRVNGKLERSEGAVLTAEDVGRIALAQVGSQRLERIGREVGRVEVSCGLPGQVTGRMTIAKSLGDYTIVIRLLPSQLMTPAQGRVPQAVVAAANLPHGLVIFSGPSGSGKTTSMLAVVDDINARRAAHICTVEDPISAIITPKMGFVQQREVGLDVPDIRSGIVASCVQDPDVIVVSVLRSAEDVQAAVTAANTGHMVIVQLHCGSPQEAIQRLIDAQPEEYAGVFRRELAQAFVASCSQVLLASAPGKGRVPAFGVLIGDDEMKQAIREGRDVMSRKSPFAPGCQTLAQDIQALVKEGRVSPDAGKAG
jgi:twitching motility protein PilT